MRNTSVESCPAKPAREPRRREDVPDPPGATLVAIRQRVSRSAVVKLSRRRWTASWTLIEARVTAGCRQGSSTASCITGSDMAGECRSCR